jgi:hypothetical protein
VVGGDGHVAALFAAGIGGRESHVLQHLAIGNRYATGVDGITTGNLAILQALSG